MSSKSEVVGGSVISGGVRRVWSFAWQVGGRGLRRRARKELKKTEHQKLMGRVFE